jgi:hypothetical protein
MSSQQQPRSGSFSVRPQAAVRAIKAGTVVALGWAAFAANGVVWAHSLSDRHTHVDGSIGVIARSQGEIPPRTSGTRGLLAQARGCPAGLQPRNYGGIEFCCGPGHLIPRGVRAQKSSNFDGTFCYSSSSPVDRPSTAIPKGGGRDPIPQRPPERENASIGDRIAQAAREVSDALSRLLRGAGNTGAAITSELSSRRLGDGILEPRTVAGTMAAIAAILVAAGIAASLAQAIAAALTNAAQAGIELTAQDIGQAILHTRENAGSGPRAEPAVESRPPPRPPPIIDPKSGTPFKTNDQGQYWSPGKDGEWRWMTHDEALRARAALQSEVDAAADGRKTFDDAAAKDREKWWRKQQHDADQAARDRLEKQRLAHEQVAANARARAAENNAGAGDSAADSGDRLASATPGFDNTGLGWTINTLAEFVGGSLRDAATLITEGPGALAGAIASGARAAAAALSDRANWEAIGATLTDIGGVMIGHQGRIQKVATNVAAAGSATADVADKLMRAAEKDPAGAAVAIGKAVLGIENWEKAVDPKVPVTERFARAVWGTIDTGGTLIGAGTAALKSADRIADFVRVGDRAADATIAADKVADTVKAADGSLDAARAADGASDAAKAADNASDAARAGTAAGRAGDAGGVARSTSEVPTGRRRDLLPDGRRGGPNTERPGVPKMATDPEGYVRELPSGALVDRNLANGSGYTGYQIDDMARMAKNENVIVGARTTNVDAMRHVRDGKAVPKPESIKAKTITELDTYLGARSQDKGLVGFFRPQKPDPNKVPSHLWEKANDRYAARLAEFTDDRARITRLVTEGKVIEREGKLHAVIRRADGTTEVKAFAGDIDGVYFKDATTNRLIPPGERYDDLRRKWMGATDGSGAGTYWARSGAPGQHGVETNLVADLTRGLKHGTPEYDEALAKARALHAKLAQSHHSGKEVILEMRPDGHLRRGLRFSDDASLPDLTRPS